MTALDRPAQAGGAERAVVAEDLAIVGCGVVVDAVPAMFPGMARVGSDLLVSFSTVPDGWPGGAIGVVRSGDDGMTWSSPEIIVEAAGGLDAVLNAVAMTALSDGTVLLPFNGVRWSPGEGVAGRLISAHLARSSDGGRTWSAGTPVAVEFHSPAVYGAMIEFGDGTLAWPVWGQRTPDERWRSVLLRSADGGLSWEVGATIAYDPDARLSGDYVHPAVSGLGSDGSPDVDQTAEPDFRPHSPVDGFSETTVGALDDGRLLAVLRQQGVGGDDTALLFRAHSADAGRSWSRYEPLGFGGMSPLLHRSASGRLLLASRRCAPDGGVGAPGVELRIGSADGTRWSEPEALADPHGYRWSAEYQCGYPAMADLPGGDVLVVFYSYDPDRRRRFVAWNRISLVTKPARS